MWYKKQKVAKTGQPRSYCTKCKRKLYRDTMTYLGKTSYGKPRHICKDCSTHQTI